MTAADAAHTLRLHIIDSLSYLNNLLHELEGDGALTRDEVRKILGVVEASPSVRADPPPQRVKPSDLVHTRRTHVPNSPGNTGQDGQPLDTATTGDDRADVRDVSNPISIRKHAGRRYGPSIATVRARYPAEAADIEAYVRALMDEAAKARIEARDAREGAS